MSIPSVIRRAVWTLSAFFACLLIAPWALADKDDVEVWHLNVQFTVGIDDYSGDEKATFDAWLDDQIARAELLFNTKPALKIHKTVVRKKRAGGLVLSELLMDSGKDYAKFMDANFDTMAKTKTDGYFQILVVNDVCVGWDKEEDGTKVRHCIGGRATFPHFVDPLSRKHGIILTYPDSRDHVLAHELGHTLSLKHTFEPYVNADRSKLCNQPYEPSFADMDGGHCKSCRTGDVDFAADTCTGEFNLMDYCDGANDDVYLNTCQRQRAVDQRRTYMTRDGDTNYFRLKGRLGEPVCKANSDCDDGEYCNKGVATVGRNTCQSTLGRWQACTKDHQCSSGDCKHGLCYTPDSIAYGNDCHFDDECKKGQCSSGPLGQPKGKCVCSSDADCGSSEYCNEGVAGIGTNVCKPKLSKWQACTQGRQCSSGTCNTGLCITPDSINFGSQCHFTDECKEGQCSSGPAGWPIGSCVCSSDADCGSSEYCNEGVAGIGTNVCKPKLGKWQACTQGRQCSSGTCNTGLCITPDSINFGSQCHFTDECKEGQCSSGPAGWPLGKCVCSSDGDCDSDEYCNEGVAGIGTNVCKAKLGKWQACTQGRQCASGTCKTALCITPNSINFGNQCHFTDECKKGKCSSGPAGWPIGSCVCENDGDCGSEEYCNKGVGGIGTNTCKDKLAKGKACTSGHQCQSGKCTFFTCAK